MSGVAAKKGRAKVAAVDKLFLPYQKKWIEDASRLKLAEKSRQIGWSWAEAYRTVRNTSRKDWSLDHWISSRDDIQARLFLADAKKFGQVLQLGAQDLGEQVVDTHGNTAYALALANGTRINSMSSNPDAQAGKRGARTLDEFALHKDPRQLYSIAYPGITWGGDLAIFSTHRGSANFFNQLILEARHKGNPKGFSLHRVTLQDALDQGFLAKLQSKLPAGDPIQEMDEAAYFDFIKSGCADKETFDQEYMCIPDDDASAFISYGLIDGCKYHPAEEWETARLAEIADPMYIGVDVGRVHDLTVIYLIQRTGGVNFTRRMIELRNTPFEEQERELYALLALPNVRRCCIDHTGLGRQFAERAQKRFGATRVEAVGFTAPVKEELAYPVRAAFEDRSIRIPDDAKLISDLRGIRKETTASGNIRFTGERSESGHCDRFWALALALHAGKKTGLSGTFGRITRQDRKARGMALRRDRRMLG